LPELAEHRILGPVTEGVLQRITVLADYRSAPQTIAALRAYVVGRGSTTVRVHCDDPAAFDEPSAD
jgi:hypothetical protein